MKKLFIFAVLALSVTMTGCISDIRMPDIFSGSDTTEAAPTKVPATTNKGSTSTTGADSTKGTKSYVVGQGEAVIVIGESNQDDVRKQLGAGDVGSGFSFDTFTRIRQQKNVTKVTIVGGKGPVTLDARRLSRLEVTYGHGTDVTNKRLPVTGVRWTLVN